MKGLHGARRAIEQCRGEQCASERGADAGACSREL